MAPWASLKKSICFTDITSKQVKMVSSIINGQFALSLINISQIQRISVPDTVVNSSNNPAYLSLAG